VSDAKDVEFRSLEVLVLKGPILEVLVLKGPILGVLVSLTINKLQRRICACDLRYPVSLGHVFNL
jgi:hypothetical protein